MVRLRRWGGDLAASFDLGWRSLDAEQDGVTEHYGICYEDGVIRIRLRHATTGKLLKESSLVDTVCHELAHLRHFTMSSPYRTSPDPNAEDPWDSMAAPPPSVCRRPA